MRLTLPCIIVYKEAGAPEKDSSLDSSNPRKVTSPTSSLRPCSVSFSTRRARICAMSGTIGDKVNNIQQENEDGAQEVTSTIHCITALGLTSVEVVRLLSVERSSQNEREISVPHVLPLDVFNLEPGQFVGISSFHKGRFKYLMGLAATDMASYFFQEQRIEVTLGRNPQLTTNLKRAAAWAAVLSFKLGASQE